MFSSELRAFRAARTLVTSIRSMDEQLWSLMNVTPLHDRLIVHRIDEGEQTVGGIIVPDSAKEKPQRGKVFAVGLGKVKEDGSRQPPDVKSGDTILFGKYSGQEIKIDGEDYLIMREDDVLAIIDSK
jgi:chaperonin GroES